MNETDPADIPVEEGRKRVVIEAVKPEIDGQRFPIKRVTGERVVVEADIFADSHDALSCMLLYKKEEESLWTEVPMKPLGNDRWGGSFLVTKLGWYRYSIEAWIDRFTTWRQRVEKKLAAGQDISVDVLAGIEIIEEASPRAPDIDGEKLQAWARLLRSKTDPSEKVQLALDEELARMITKYPDRQLATTYGREFMVVVDRERARFSSWYEVFPRSCALEPRRHGTFKDCEERLPYIAGMGFNVLYLPPVHPIGYTHRKGKNNAYEAGPGDTGSPWAIGSEEGGHKSVHPRLGTLKEFRHLVKKAEEHGMEVAIDLAFQCSPDHPYVQKHPEWFQWRPDGTLQYAENPPKKYEDIYPLNFETEQWKELWEELKSVALFWLDQGVRIFRVDNPHTKPFAFWEWLINEIKKDHPEVIFLAEAFTRPKVMHRLAKLGFSQSYTYFAWRNTKWELTQYFSELYHGGLREFFRPNLWPNTPDILTEYLQMGGRPAFVVRLILAATLGANYGIYGPAFELTENRAKHFGSEEYLDSEKYEIKQWDCKRPNSLKDLIARVNRIRRENPALQSDWSLRFHPVDNEQIICYSKHTEDFLNIVLVIVNLDPHHTHSGWLDLSISDWGLEPVESYQVHDLLSEARYLWYSSRNYVEINPQVVPAHIFRIRRRIRTERDFDYYM
ncbi:MAG: alpha-1,4-glucan--maltose-1-phosphate maltosyltransferase [Thermodesulfobacteriota bacterium]